MSKNIRLWLKCVGIFAVFGLVCWWIWDNPLFIREASEPGPFYDYDPVIVGTITWAYFFPAIVAVVAEGKYSPISFILNTVNIDITGTAGSILGFLVATILLPIMYGTVAHVLFRLVRKIYCRVHKTVTTEKSRKF